MDILDSFIKKWFEGTNDSACNISLFLHVGDPPTRSSAVWLIKLRSFSFKVLHYT